MGRANSRTIEDIMCSSHHILSSVNVLLWIQSFHQRSWVRGLHFLKVAPSKIHIVRCFRVLRPQDAIRRSTNVDDVIHSAILGNAGSIGLNTVPKYSSTCRLWTIRKIDRCWSTCWVIFSELNSRVIFFRVDVREAASTSENITRCSISENYHSYCWQSSVYISDGIEG